MTSVIMLGLLGLVYWLYQENQYLSYLNRHPGHIRARGPRTAQVISSDLAPSAWLGLLCCQWTYFWFTRRTTSKHWFKEVHTFSIRPCPIPPRLSLAYAILGLIGIAFGIFWVSEVIAAFVWERYFSFTKSMSAPYITFWMGSMVVWQGLRDYQSHFFGTKPRLTPEQLPRDQLENIRAAIFAGDNRRAFRIYCKASQSSLAEASEEIENLIRLLREKCPGEFRYQLKPPWKFDFKKPAKILLVVALCMVPLLVAVGPTRGWGFCLEFFTGWLYGAVIFFTRVIRNVWLRTLVIFALFLPFWWGNQSLIQYLPFGLLGFVVGFSSLQQNDKWNPR